METNIKAADSSTLFGVAGSYLQPEIGSKCGVICHVLPAVSLLHASSHHFCRLIDISFQRNVQRHGQNIAK